MTQGSGYVIRGGVEGRERLQILSRLLQPTTLALLDRAGVRPGMRCLDLGCGSADVAFDLAGLVGSSGHVIGTDIDAVKIALAQREAQARNLANVVFRVDDAARSAFAPEFDLVHARFLITHLADPQALVATMRGALRPGGTVIVVDIDFRGYFSHPESPALWRYVD